MVLTRSQTRVLVHTNTEYEVNIDFDGAIAAWNANKKKFAQGYYKYICGHILNNGKRCNRPSNCRIHK